MHVIQNRLAGRIAGVALALSFTALAALPASAVDYEVSITGTDAAVGSTVEVPVVLERMPSATNGPAVLSLRVQHDLELLQFVGFDPSPLLNEWYNKSASAQGPSTGVKDSHTDVNVDGVVNSEDLQWTIREALALSTPHDADVNGDGSVNAVDVQLVLNDILFARASNEVALVVSGFGTEELTTFDDQRPGGNPNSQDNPLVLGDFIFEVIAGGPLGATIQTDITVTSLDAADGEATPITAMGSVDGTVTIIGDDDFAIDFPDPGLEAALREALEKPQGDILYSDFGLLENTTLDASNRGIADLTGLEYAFGLEYLDLSGNQIEDIFVLTLNTGLEPGTEINLSTNPLSGASCGHVATLRSRGLVVRMDDGCMTTIGGVIHDAETDEPISCATVVAEPVGKDSHGFDPVAPADFNGAYQFDALAPGAYVLTVYAPGYEEAVSFVELGEDASIFEPFLLIPDLRRPDIVGTVRDIDRGTVVPGVRVEAYIDNELAAVSYTCGTGRYAITGLFGESVTLPKQTTTVVLEFTSETYDTEQRIIEVDPDEGAESNPQMSPKIAGPGSLTGVVMRTGSNAPIANARVTLGNSLNLTVDTNADGVYAVGALPEGNYSIQASAEGFGGQTQRKNIPGFDITTANFVLSPLVSGNPADINGDGQLTAVDVQLVVNAALGIDIGDFNADVNNDQQVSAVDVQMVINAVLGV